jgi:hypothetical protein
MLLATLTVEARSLGGEIELFHDRERVVTSAQSPTHFNVKLSTLFVPSTKMKPLTLESTLCSEGRGIYWPTKQERKARQQRNGRSASSR